MAVPTLAQQQLRVDPGFAAAVNAGALHQKMTKPAAGPHFNADTNISCNSAIAQRIVNRN